MLIRGHFGELPGWPFFLPPRIIARLSRGRILEAFEDGVQTGCNGSVAVSCRVLVAAGGGRVGAAEAGHELPLGGACPGGERPGRMAEIVEVEIVASDQAPLSALRRTLSPTVRTQARPASPAATETSLSTVTLGLDS